MATPESTLEIEVKLRIRDKEAFLTALSRAGFDVSKPRVFEHNVVFDTPGGDLRTRGVLLRLREVEGTAIVTFKGKSLPGPHKRREELEIAVSDYRLCAIIFERLGFFPSFVYQKYRTEFEGSDKSGVLTLDETPIGTYVELEGTSEWIDSTARYLGFAATDYITASYAALYFQHCAELGLVPSHMIFPDRS